MGKEQPSFSEWLNAGWYLQTFLICREAGDSIPPVENWLREFFTRSKIPSDTLSKPSDAALDAIEVSVRGGQLAWLKIGMFVTLWIELAKSSSNHDEVAEMRSIVRRLLIVGGLPVADSIQVMERASKLSFGGVTPSHERLLLMSQLEDFASEVEATQPSISSAIQLRPGIAGLALDLKMLWRLFFRGRRA